MKEIKLFLMILSVVICTALTLSVSAEDTESTETVETQITQEAVTTVCTDEAETEITEISEVTSQTEPTIVIGWINDDGKWFYSDENGFLTGKQLIDGEYYIFADNGALRTGWQTVNSLRFFYDSETHSPSYGWIEYQGEKYYCDSKSGKLSGIHEIDGNTYIFSEEGIMQTGFVMCDDFMYYCNSDGTVKKNNDKTTPVLINDTYYIISSQGQIARGWQNVNGLRLFYDYETAEPVYGWIEYQDNVYYIDEKIGKCTDVHNIDGRPYRFAENGILQTGMQSFDKGKTCYYFSKDQWAEGFFTYRKAVYYFDKNGYMQTGWKSLNGQTYYFGSNGKMRKGLSVIDGEKYYFDKKGNLQTGFIDINNHTYYFANDGKMLYDWQSVNGSKYFFGKDGRMRTGWQTINSKTYYLGSDGKMKTSLCKIGNDTYFFGDDGAMKTGFHIIDGKYYNFGSDGKHVPIKVFVGVGHGGRDGGAVGYIVEKEYTLKTAKAVEEYLKDTGLDYMLSREEDIDTTMEGKLKQCNDYDPDVIFDIHFNAVGGSGFEVYHSKNGGFSQTLAENINNEVSQFMHSRGCKIFLNAQGKDRFTIIRETHAPSVLIEGGYVDDWYDAQFIKNNYRKLALAYVKGLLKTIEEMFG